MDVIYDYYVVASFESLQKFSAGKLPAGIHLNVWLLNWIYQKSVISSGSSSQSLSKYLNTEDKEDVESLIES